MLRNKNNSKYWFHLCAASLLTFELGVRVVGMLPGRFDAQHESSETVGEQFSLIRDAVGRPPIWDCGAVVEIALNFQHVPPLQRHSMRMDIQSAVEDINRVSGFSFRLVGPTRAVPTSSWGTDWRRYTPATPVVIAFGSGGDTDLLPPGAAAVGGQFSSIDSDGQRRATAGWVYVDTRHLEDYPPGRGYLGRVGLFTHELLHVLGLGHVDSRQSGSLMTPRLSDSSGYLGAGDIAGLRQLEAVSCSMDSP